MMKIIRIFTLLFIVVLIPFVSLHSQKKTKQDYEREKKALQQKIALGNKVLDEIATEKKVSVTELRAINRQISARKTLLYTYEQELKLVTDEMSELGDIIEAMQSDTARLKKEYAKMVFEASRLYNNNSHVSFIFSAKTVDQMSKRIEFLKQFNNVRHDQVKKIKGVLESLKIQQVRLQKSKAEKAKLVAEMKGEKTKLDLLRQQHDRLVDKLRKREKEQRKEIEKWEKRQKELDKIIQKFIKEQLKKEERKGGLTLEERKQVALLSKDFMANKGRLPWPLDRCSISRKFGKQKNPVLDIYENNLGIGLLSERGAVVKSVFDGKVAVIATLRGQNKMVMIKHGSYFTVYINITNVTVHTGDQVKVGQKLGSVATNLEGITELEFHVWKGNGANSAKLNPESWLVK